ncbi:MAG: DNA polymerase I [Deltaproteobacteria bacterium]|nr:DNA polymerase I [Deltaproteobacteria bacterium]
MDEIKKKSLFIIDGSSLIYRAFHAIPTTLTNSRGMPTNAVYGFTQSLLKIIKGFAPEYICVSFDVKGPSFRHEIFADYKAQRPSMPDLLSVQMPYVKSMVRALNIAALEKEGFEADDLIATLVKRFSGPGVKVSIITGDKDMYQLVDENTIILDYLTAKEYGVKEVEEKFGVGPGKIKDLMALAGDPVDNIPGVPGVGAKTAAKLIRQFHSLDGIFERPEEVTSVSLRDKLIKHREQALLSRELATLHPDVDIECTLEGIRYRGPDIKTLEPLMMELGFKKLLRDIGGESASNPVSTGDCILVFTDEGLDEAIGSLKGLGKIAIGISSIGEKATDGLRSLALAASGDKAYFIPFSPAYPSGMDEAAVLNRLKRVLEDGRIEKETDDSKSLHLHLKRVGIALRGIGVDIALASYLLDPSRPEHTVESLSYEFLGDSMGEGGGKEGTEDLETAKIKTCKKTCKKTCNILILSEILNKKLEENGLKKLYMEIELPLSEVLASMEEAGIKVDVGLLRELSREAEAELARIEERIYTAAGTTFNINSPKQLSELLFERLGLRPVKRTKTGFSTDEEVLTRLSAGHDVPALILSYRQLSKLKSTYMDALSELVDPADGRVHTSFNQTVTATGRLSSSRPNMQNIPVRGEMAGRVREVFVAPEGFSFLCADYSQIELRLVAHMSGDQGLMESFRRDEDIHTRTASEVFGIMPELVTSEMRRRAKAINFGIIYGMGPYGLSTELGITVNEATRYIESYFSHYGKVKEFIDATVEEARRRGYTTTMFGRRRFIPELKSPVEQTVKLGHRLAINTPIQGTAADMIKAAMVGIHRLFQQKKFRSRMILQIHDELIFETAAQEFDEVKELVRDGMERVLELTVPVKVNMKSGANWRVVE